VRRAKLFALTDRFTLRAAGFRRKVQTQGKVPTTPERFGYEDEVNAK
jgi:hypothetical protein